MFIPAYFREVFWEFDHLNVVGYSRDPQTTHTWQKTRVLAYRSSRPGRCVWKSWSCSWTARIKTHWAIVCCKLFCFLPRYFRVLWEIKTEIYIPWNRLQTDNEGKKEFFAQVMLSLLTWLLSFMSERLRDSSVMKLKLPVLRCAFRVPLLSGWYGLLLWMIAKQQSRNNSMHSTPAWHNRSSHAPNYTNILTYI